MHEGQPSKNETKSYAEVLSGIESCLAEGKEQEFTENRLQEIDATSEGRNFGQMYAHFLKGYLRPDAKIQRSPMVDPFAMDDSALYSELFETIKKFREIDGWKEKELRIIMPEIIQHTISKYFGNEVATSGTENRNREFYLDHGDDPDSKAVSLDELKGKGIAVCAEKAAAAQNLVTFAGLESYLVMAECNLSGERDENHAYNVLKTENGYFIYDPTNPKLILEKETNHLISSYAAIYKISDEDFTSIKLGKEVKVQHIDIYEDTKGRTEPSVQERIYRGPDKI